MFLSQAPSGIFYLYYNDIKGKRQKVSTKTKSRFKAEYFLRSFDLPKAQNKVEEYKLMFEYFSHEFISYAEGTFSKGTAEIYRYTFNNFLDIFSDISLLDITPRHYDLYKVSRLKKVSPVSVNIELRSLKAALNTALRWGTIQKNPFAGLKLVPLAERVPLYFTKENFQTLISTIREGWLKEAVIFSTLTGLRRNELIHLKWDDVDLQKKTIRIQTSPTFKTKHGKRRIIPLHEATVYLLQSIKQRTQPGFVFQIAGRKISDSWLSHLFKRYVRECEFKESQLHWHSLRHTFASWLVQEGVSIYSVKELLGHSDIKVTQIYAHLQSEYMHDTVNKLRISL